MTYPAQLTLAPPAVAGLFAVEMAEANAWLADWGHYLGECHRPFHQEGWVLSVVGDPVSVAVSASSVSSHVTCAHGFRYERRDMVELARLASGQEWATRPMLRLWREVAAKAWRDWTCRVVIAYSQNNRHEGDLYRWDGWELCSTTAGSSGGGTWSKSRGDDHAAKGDKKLWLYHFDHIEAT